MNWRRLLLIPIVLAGTASILATGPDENPAPKLATIAATTCPAASISVSITIATVQKGSGDWATTATGSVTCTSTTPATPLANVQVGINWPWNEQVIATTDAKGNFKVTATKAGQPSGTATAGVQPAAPAGGAQPAPVTATSNKL
jgi:hypothetical protein